MNWDESVRVKFVLNGNDRNHQHCCSIVQSIGMDSRVSVNDNVL